MLRIQFFLEVLEQALSSGQFCLAVPPLDQPFKYLTQLSRSLREPFGFKCIWLLFKCFGGCSCVTNIKGVSLLSLQSFKQLFTFITIYILHFVCQTHELHCVKSVQIRSYFWSVFSRIRTVRSISPYSVQMRENTDQK